MYKTKILTGKITYSYTKEIEWRYFVIVMELFDLKNNEMSILKVNKELL